MTSPRGDAPKLDRLLTRTMLAQGPLTDRVFTFDYRSVSQSSFRTTAGEWAYGETFLKLAETDANGRILPVVDNVPIDAQAIFTLTGANYTVSFVATAYTIPRSSFNQLQPDARRVDFDAGSIDGASLPGLRTAGAMTLTFPATAVGTEEREVKVWHRRTDFTAADFVKTAEAGLVTVKDTKLLVRASTGPWTEGDAITDDEGRGRRIDGVSQVGRGRYIELLARRIG